MDKKTYEKFKRVLALLLIAALCIPNISYASAASKAKSSTKKVTMEIGDKRQLSIPGMTKKASIKISNKKIAAVDKNGKVTAKKSGKATVTVKVGKKTYKYTVTVKKPTDITISTKDFSYDEAEKWYVVSKKFSKLNGTLKNPSQYSKLEIKVVADNGVVVQKKTRKPAAKWSFSKVGLYPGTSKVVVTAIGKKKVSKTVRLRDIAGLNRNYLPGAKKDTDKDKLSDLDEKYFKTNKKKKDTDKDGLTDYQEVKETMTNPKKKDSDGNGVSDYDEDYDQDGISNGEEYKHKTNPSFADSDFDGLNDGEEINKHKTNPLKEDTDGDGATDFWEVSNGYNPLVADSTFKVKASAAEPSKSNPIAPSVELSLTSGDVSSLEVTPLDVNDNPYINPTVVGYLGQAYDFSVDGTFNSATLNFEYDSSLGKVGDDFQPRIYYFNEATKMFEELPNQKVSNGKVSATVSHFSTYILMNKAEVDTMWDVQLRKPTAATKPSNGAISTFFIIDVSGSMNTNDKTGLRLDLTDTFINKLDTSKDLAAISSFNSSFKNYSGLTNDPAALHEAVYQIRENKNSGGTNGTLAINDAINQLKQDTSGNERFIIHLTDGQDSGLKSNREKIVAEAKANNIMIFTIGLLEKTDENLKKLAEETGGAYYHAHSSDDFETIFNDTAHATMDFTSDSNGDGITDYYTEQIMNGKILLSNGSRLLQGIDLNYNENFNLSDDWDNDGLKNIQEIQLMTAPNGTLYLNMISNPCLADTDGDGLSDYDEVKCGTNPLEKNFSVDNNNLDILKTNGYYYMSSEVENYKDGWLQEKVTQANALIYGVWNKDKLYRNLMIDYYSKYDFRNNLKKAEQEFKRQAMQEVIYNVIGSNVWDSICTKQEKVNDVNSYVNFGNTVPNMARTAYALLGKINSLNPADIDTVLNNGFSNFITKVQNISAEATDFRFSCQGIENHSKVWQLSSVQEKVNKFANGANIMSNILTYANIAVSAASDLATQIGNAAIVSANNELFSSNMEVYDYIIANSKDSHARDACVFLKEQLAGNYFYCLTEVANAWRAETSINILIGYLAGTNAIVMAYAATTTLLDALTDIKQDIIEQYEMLCYQEMETAYIALIDTDLAAVSGSNSYFYSHITSLGRITNLAQLRVVGEIKYHNWKESDGWLKKPLDKWMNMTQVKKDINNQLNSIKKLIEAMKLPVSDKLKYSV